MKKYAVVIGLVLSIGGCSGGGTAVKGKVTLSDGSPAPRGSVIYSADSGTFRGGIQPDGTYSIEGVTSGDYSVSVTGVMDSEPSGDGMSYDDSGNYVESAAPAPKSLIDTKYGDPGKSGLKVTVPGSYDLSLDSAAGTGTSSASSPTPTGEAAPSE
ncbi:MAG: carboxypeptidase regulatory-like domain-containing protein [Planctomycetaceae bacterium]|nr:carboxypeptidase regulatory-like domain-containing protein [Planctomycetales bacterium]MCB9921105.1 carboxypeptidase regulatory-like domain-containing protein [Planctomycetaceae bacterium]